MLNLYIIAKSVKAVVRQLPTRSPLAHEPLGGYPCSPTIQRLCRKILPRLTSELKSKNGSEGAEQACIISNDNDYQIMQLKKKVMAAIATAAGTVLVAPLAFAATLSTPTGLMPANGSMLTSDQWTSASWNAVNSSSTPVTYQYEASNSSTTNADGSFASPAFQSGPIASTSISTTNTPAGTWFWHVMAMDSSGATSTWSAPSMVTITNATSTPTTTPSVNAPSGLTPNGVTLTSDQWTSASWNAVTASATPVTYNYESSNSSATNADGSFASPAFQSNGIASTSISTANTPAGTWYWHVQAMDNNGTMSPWSSTATVTVANNGTTTPPSSNLDQLIAALQGLAGQFPSFSGQIQAFITELMNGGNGTTTPPSTSKGTIDQNGGTFSKGGTIDFGGRNFNHEEDITVTLNGATVAHAHADGGGNFSTGSLSLPSSAGTYTYTFTGASGDSASATITVM